MCHSVVFSMCSCSLLTFKTICDDSYPLKTSHVLHVACILYVAGCSWLIQWVAGAADRWHLDQFLIVHRRDHSGRASSEKNWEAFKRYNMQFLRLMDVWPSKTSDGIVQRILFRWKREEALKPHDDYTKKSLSKPAIAILKSGSKTWK